MLQYLSIWNGTRLNSMSRGERFRVIINVNGRPCQNLLSLSRSLSLGRDVQQTEMNRDDNTPMSQFSLTDKLASQTRDKELFSRSIYG